MTLEYKGYSAIIQITNTDWSSIMEGLGHTLTVVIKQPSLKGSRGLDVDEELIAELFAEWFAEMIEKKLGDVKEDTYL